MASLKKITPHHVLLVCFALIVFKLCRLAEGDTMMHLRIGQYFIQHHTVLLKDVFSYTMYGKDWVSHEWLFEVFMYGVFHQYHFAGLTFMTVAMVMISAYIISEFYQQQAQSFGWFSINVLFVFLFYKMHLVPRPHLLTYLFMAQYLYLLLNLHHSTSRLWTIPLSMLLWTNSHGGYMMGLVLVWMVLGVEYFDTRKHAWHALERWKLKKLLLTAVLTTICAVIKPGGFRDIGFPFQMAQMEITPYISEWASFNYHTIWGKLYLIFVIYSLTLWGLKKTPERSIYFILTLFFITIGLMAVRHMPLSVLGLVFLNASRYPTFGKSMFPNKTIVDQDAQHMVTRGFVYLLIIVLMTGLLVKEVAQYNSHASQQFDALFPEKKAIDYIKSHQISPRLFNPQEIGGYMIFALFPDRKVFVDGRVDLYGDAFMRDYLTLVKIEHGWETILRKHRFDHMLLKKDAPLAQLLLALNVFKTEYQDEHYIFLSRIRD